MTLQIEDSTLNYTGWDLKGNEVSIMARSIKISKVAFFCLAGFIFFCSTLSAYAAGEPKTLKVLSIMPQGQVQRITQIVVVFDRDMVPLGASLIEPKDSPLKISPRPTGSFRWLDPRSLAFILDKPAVGAQRFDLKISAQTTALDGARLAKDVTTHVSTPAISLLKISPPIKKPLGPMPQLDLILNQEVDLASLKRGAWFEMDGKRLPAQVKKAEIPSWQREQLSLASRYLVSCAESFPPQKKLKLILDAGIKPAAGNLALDKPIIVNYQTYGPLKLVKWNINRGPDKKADPQAGLFFTL